LTEIADVLSQLSLASQQVMPFLPLALFSLLAFWKENALLFMLSAGASMMVGLYWYDAYTNPLGLSLSLTLIAYSLVCLGLALKLLFWKEKSND